MDSNKTSTSSSDNSHRIVTCVLLTRYQYFMILKLRLTWILKYCDTIIFSKRSRVKWMQQNIEKSWRTIGFSVQETGDLGEDLFSSKTMTQSIQIKVLKDGLKSTRWMSWSGRVRAQTSVQHNDWQWTWKVLFTPDPCATWQSFEQFCRRTGWNCSVQMCKTDRDFFTKTVLWLRPKVHLLLHTAVKGLNSYAVTYFTSALLCRNLFSLRLKEFFLFLILTMIPFLK